MQQLLEQYDNKEYQGHKKSVFSLDWNCTGSKLASASSDGSIRIWELQQYQLEKGLELKGHSDMIEQLEFNPVNSNILGSVSNDKTLRIWDIRIPKANIKIEKMKGCNINMAWSKDSKYIAVGNKEDVLTIYDYNQQQISNQIEFDKYKIQVNEICWDQTNKYLFVSTGSDNNNSGPIYVLDGHQPDYPPIYSLQSHQSTCLCLCTDQKGKYLASGAEDNIISIWDANYLIQLFSITNLNTQIRQLSFNYQGYYLAVATEADEIALFDLNHYNQKYSISCKSKQNTVIWHPTANILAYAGDDKNKSNDEKGVVNLFTPK